MIQASFKMVLAMGLMILLTVAAPLSAESAPICRQIHLEKASGTPKSPAVHIGKLLELGNKAIEESSDPYSLSHDIRKASTNLPAFKNEIQTLLHASLHSTSSLTRAQAFNDWVRSEEHALFLYDLLNRVGLSNFKLELNYLHEQNVYFIESTKSEGSFVTYAYEKEGNSPDIGLLFKSPDIPTEQWLQMSEKERMKLLQALNVPKKTFTKASQVTPTDLKPDSVGGYSEELNDRQKGDYGWEIAHKKYEINRQRVMRQIRDLAQLFKETHSFHMHIVFEIPKKYEKYQNFIFWYKKLNDYLYLKGLEEGLHGNYLTGVANISKDISWNEKIKNWIKSFYTLGSVPKTTIPESQKNLDAQNSKFFSAGLRTDIYGPASSGENMKIGIELRDTTRQLNLLDLYSEQITTAIKNKNWENGDLSQISASTLRLTSDRPTARTSMTDLLSPEYVKLFAQIEPTVHFGLIRYEQAQIWDYKSKSFVKIPEEARLRIQKARENYENDLKSLEQELRELTAKNEKTEEEIIKIAIRMSLATWAKAARVSEFFSGL